MANIFLKNVHVINLERSKDRLQHIDANLKKFGIKYQRFNAVDGNKLSMDDIDKNVTTMCRYMLCTKPIIGCSMSHLSLWKQIAKSPDKWHLILEDDGELTDETINFFNDLANSSLINDDDIIISLTCNSICEGPSINIPVKSETDNAMNNLLVKPMFPSGFAAYLITKNTAKKIYDFVSKNKINYYPDLQIIWNISKIGIKYYATRDHVVKLSEDRNNSTLGSKSLPLLYNFLSTIGFSKLAWHLTSPIVALNLSIPINAYVLIFLVLLALNFFILGSVLIYLYLLLELALFIMVSLTN